VVAVLEFTFFAIRTTLFPFPLSSQLELSEPLGFLLVVVVRMLLLRRHEFLIKHIAGVAAFLFHYLFQAPVDQLQSALNHACELAVELVFKELGLVWGLPG